MQAIASHRPGDCWGGDISNGYIKDVASIEDCTTLCSQRADCTRGVYSQNTKECFLKNSTCKDFEDSQKRYFVKPVGASVCHPGMTPFVQSLGTPNNFTCIGADAQGYKYKGEWGIHGHEYESYALKIVRRNTIEGCAAECDRTPGCVASHIFQAYATPDKCVLISQGVPWQKNVEYNADYYIKDINRGTWS